MNSFTDSLLDNQRVRKRQGRSSGKIPAGGRDRRNSSRNAYSANAPHSNKFENQDIRFGKGKTAYRPAGVSALFEQNSRIIDKIKQEPVRIQRRKYNNASGGRKRNTGTPVFSFPNPKNFTSFFGGGEQEEAGTEKDTNIRHFPSLTLPGIPVAALLALALGFFFVIHHQGASLDWMNREVVSAGKDDASQYNLALYAGVNPEEKAPENSSGPDAAAANAKPGDTIPLDLTESFAWQTYKVKKGDTVSKLAVAYSVSMDAIIASNGITNARALREGEVLRIPNMDGIPYTVKGGDTLSAISKSMGVPLEAILDANDIRDDKINAGMSLFIPGARMKKDDLKMALGELFMYPLKGSRLSSPFGWRNDPFTGVRSYHAAVDLAAPMGTAVKAAMDGKVAALGYNATYGNYIILSHSGGFQTMYAHLNSTSVKKGDQVSQGFQIGAVGTTGYSTGPHLHFALFKNGRAVNPLDFLNPKN